MIRHVLAAALITASFGASKAQAECPSDHLARIVDERAQDLHRLTAALDGELRHEFRGFPPAELQVAVTNLCRGSEHIRQLIAIPGGINGVPAHVAQLDGYFRAIEGGIGGCRNPAIPQLKAAIQGNLHAILHVLATHPGAPQFQQPPVFHAPVPGPALPPLHQPPALGVPGSGPVLPQLQQPAVYRPVSSHVRVGADPRLVARDWTAGRGFGQRGFREHDFRGHQFRGHDFRGFGRGPDRVPDFRFRTHNVGFRFRLN